MIWLFALLLLFVVFGGLGFVVHVLWYVLIISVLIWLISFFLKGSRS